MLNVMSINPLSHYETQLEKDIAALIFRFHLDTGETIKKIILEIATEPPDLYLQIDYHSESDRSTGAG